MHCFPFSFFKKSSSDESSSEKSSKKSKTLTIKKTNSLRPASTSLSRTSTKNQLRPVQSHSSARAARLEDSQVWNAIADPGIKPEPPGPIDSEELSRRLSRLSTEGNNRRSMELPSQIRLSSDAYNLAFSRNTTISFAPPPNP
ncbi:uncharacterized protein L969DRAFT_44851 [Mixia osmundae IAM 14324]|uniref:Uncharacterized protein n=1 Tax=Mixia osmundae (strain CBS 9802 / IAM 14324 / JCM 22182 / KY 12970) TaxID=764103 RepID=G7DXZ8_MIXOS|nr:uncharacterized protein L969DRAFT_44851 [Mixia osmundae IAM 14324]KEI41358.1 hypothetical protein L969DRAFT_44851 [Mixia osmundae IAM 14324]GAA95458.1 hypothetical protein E5Q_02112 [Mixia osmundae IAM 14324]